MSGVIMKLRYTITMVLLLCTSQHGALATTASEYLDWQALLEDPDPAELMGMAAQYERADGVLRDYSRARQLYCASARLGYRPAQIRLAWMYSNGLGSPQDPDLAAAWLRVAAADGSLQARKFLALINAPESGRQPRCTYESRFDEYAVATIPAYGPDDSYGGGVMARALSGNAPRINGSDDPSRRQIEQWVRRLAPHYGLDPELVLAVIHAESAFNPDARSHKNAHGLMQLIPATARRFGVRNINDPAQNLHGGMAYLRWLLAYFKGNLEHALAGYNAGEGAVMKYRGIPPYRETRHYVRKVIRTYGRKTHPDIAMKLSAQ
jgi:soluble lytic murein transglycosylase-like protein